MLEYNLGLESDSRNHKLTLDALAQSFPFYPIEVGYFNANDTYYTKRSELNNYLVIITIDGCGRMLWNGQNCLLEKGSAVLIDCSSYQEYATMPGQTWAFYYIHFSASSMEGYRHLFFHDLTPVRLRKLRSMCQLMEQIYQRTFETSALTCVAQSNDISALLTEMATSLAESGNESDHLNRPEIVRLAEFIRENCTQPLHISDFVEYVHLSKHHLIRTFERQIGLSPYKYLHLCRIDRSLLLLKNTELSISQISDMVGYNDSVVFIRHFKAFHKIPPREYRTSNILL